MSADYFKQTTVHNESLNVRVNNLTVDGTFSHTGESELYKVVTTWADFVSAITAGFKYIVIRSTTPIVATASLTFPSGDYSIFIDCLLQMGDYSFSIPNANTFINFQSDTPINGKGITYSPLTEHALFINDTASRITSFQNIEVANLSSINNTPIQTNSLVTAYNCYFSSGGGVNNNILFNFTQSKIFISSCEFTDATINVTNVGSGHITLMGCTFIDTAIVLGVGSDFTTVIGCFTSGTTTFTDSTGNSIRAGNSATIGNDYVESFLDTHNTTWTGIYGAPVAGNINYVKIGSFVSMDIPLISANQTSGGILESVTLLPSDLIPTVSKFYNVITFSGLVSIRYSGLLVINGLDAPGPDQGKIQIYEQTNNVQYNVLTNGSPSGIQSLALSYNI